MNFGLKTNCFLFVIFIFSVSLLITSCDSVSSSGENGGVDDSLNYVEEVTPIPGADNVTLIVNSGDETYLELEFQGIEPNDIIENGTLEGWCIDWKTPISTQNGTYPGLQLYSTYRVEKWNKVNTLLNITDQLKAEDNSITFREIQAAIWVLRPHPAFDLNNVDLDELPDDMVRDGEILFDSQKVEEIVNQVKSKVNSFTYGEGTRFVVIAETPVDVQTVITVVSNQ